MATPHLQFLLAVMAGWMNRSQQEVIDYLQAENRVLREQQVARNVTDAQAGFLRGTRYLIHDRDPLFTARFQAILKSSGVEAVKLPARSPNLNAFAERFVRTIKSECLAKIIPLGERHLRLVLAEFAEHYHRERNRGWPGGC